MKRLDPPTCCASKLLKLCIEVMSDEDLRNRLNKQRSFFEAQYALYASHSLVQTWCELPRAEWSKEDQIIVEGVNKRELTDLYTKGMVASNGAARTEYDKLKLSAREDCPYCGGCGELVDDEGIGTLDHFLPKAYFPVFSVLPSNLVPACGVCNKGMGSSFPTDPNLQPLHPYFDAPNFYEEKWTIAVVREEDPVVVDFGVSPPVDWSDKDKRRVSKHFEDCKLKGRYRRKAASDISSLTYQRRTVHRSLPPEAFRAILLAVAENDAFPLNGWKRTLHRGLAESDWFCSHDFAV